MEMENIMNTENEQKLFKRFSFFKPERSITESLMAFGFDCNNGWFDLIWSLCEDLEILVKKENIKNFEVVQVKEKFGGLRFYVDYGTDAIHKRIQLAETISYTVCEGCGKPGSLDRSKLWVKTLCEKCKK